MFCTHQAQMVLDGRAQARAITRHQSVFEMDPGSFAMSLRRGLDPAG